MGAYFGTTEITNFDCLVPVNGVDITQMFFATNEIFTVWATYDGTLPAQYNANGDYLADYRVYGASGGVGDRTVNLWQKDLTKNGYYSESGSFIVSSSYTSSQAVDIIGVSSITQKFRSTYPTGFFNQFAYFDENFDFISLYRQIQSGTGIKIITNTPPNNAKYVVSSNIAASTDIMLVEGSTAPAEYVPYGYVVPMAVQTGEIRRDVVQGGWNGMDGQIVNPYNTGEFASIRCRIDPLYVDTAKTYTISAVPSSLLVAVKSVNANGRQINDTGWVDAYTVTPTANASWFGITIRKPDNSNITPADVQCVKIITSEAETPPIYIGDTPLGEDEYVSFEEQKIYRMSGDVLTPTDPPVPLPALPTFDGVTITDYAGQSAAVPSRFMAKYRKEGFN